VTRRSTFRETRELFPEKSIRAAAAAALGKVLLVLELISCSQTSGQVGEQICVLNAQGGGEEEKSCLRKRRILFSVQVVSLETELPAFVYFLFHVYLNRFGSK
jgi:hypothetical protein